MKPFFAYFILAGILLVLDLIWIGTVARDFYRRGLGSLMAENVNMAAAFGFYLIYSIGLFLFVVRPELATGDWKTAAMMGALFGLVAYATYDLTNLAVIKGFPLNIAVVDMAWGATVSAVTAGATVLLVNRFVS
ncbi:MAG: hypothetical protein APF80_07865 [Alphaproteobacteria bacterium BRH_c36]|nr:MAG: hypothetical protein APF80_07865 [Alphaproteobacteria bacterium BRH_c36]